MEQKMLKLEKWLMYFAFIPLVAVFIAGIFLKNAVSTADIVVKVSLAITGIFLIISTQILPSLRLWDYIRRANAMILKTVIIMVVYIAGYAYFYYDYAIAKSQSNIALIVFLVVLLYQRFNPTDKTVEKYVSENLDQFPEEREKREEARQKKLEEAKLEAEKLAEIEKQDAEKRESIPDFDDFFGLNDVNNDDAGKKENKK